MKEILNNWIEMLKEKNKLKYGKCNHKWKKESDTTITTPNGVRQEGRYKLYICTECGEFKNIDLLDTEL